MKFISFPLKVAEADRLRDRRDWKRAALAYQGAVTINPKAVSTWVQLGHALKESGDFAGAESAYLRALDLAPEDAEIALQLGHLFNRQDMRRDALAWYGKAARLKPDDAELLEHLRATLDMTETADAHLAMKHGRFADARDILLRLIRDYARHDLCAMLGHAYKECGQFAEAEAAYEAYRRHLATAAPDAMYDYHLQSGHLKKIQRQYHSALSHYVRARELLQQQAVRTRLAQEVNGEIGICIAALFPNLFARG